MKRSTECGNTRLERKPHKLTESVLVSAHKARKRALSVVGEISSLRCAKCGTRFDSATELERFELAAAERFLAVGLRAGSIAQPSHSLASAARVCGP